MRKGDVYVLYCKQMEWKIDCFVQTALVNMMGVWQNQTDAPMNAVFMIPMRGKVTDCYINIGSERLRSVGLAERKQQPIQFNQPMVQTVAVSFDILSWNIDDFQTNMQTMVEEQEDDVVISIKSENSSDEWVLMDSLFSQQIPGYFRIPFDNIRPNQSVRVDLYYTESLRMQDHQFYLSVPMQFHELTLPQKWNWNNVVRKIQATIHHPHFGSTNVRSFIFCCILSCLFQNKSSIRFCLISIPLYFQKQSIFSVIFTFSESNHMSPISIHSLRVHHIDYNIPRGKTNPQRSLRPILNQLNFIPTTQSMRETREESVVRQNCMSMMSRRPWNSPTSINSVAILNSNITSSAKLYAVLSLWRHSNGNVL